MYILKFMVLLFFITSCKNVAVNENLFCINPDLTEEELLGMGYELRKSLQPGDGNYKNVPLKVERSGNDLSNAEAKYWQYVDDKLEGKLILYHVDDYKIYERTVYYINKELRDNGFFTTKSLRKLMDQENCVCEIISVDTMKWPTYEIYHLVVKNNLGQQHQVKLSNTSISIRSHYQRDSLGNVTAIIPPPPQQ